VSEGKREDIEPTSMGLQGGQTAAAAAVVAVVVEEEEAKMNDAPSIASASSRAAASPSVHAASTVDLPPNTQRHTIGTPIGTRQGVSTSKTHRRLSSNIPPVPPWPVR